MISDGIKYFALGIVLMFFASYVFESYNEPQEIFREILGAFGFVFCGGGLVLLLMEQSNKYS